MLGLLLNGGACDCGGGATITKVVPQIEVDPQAVAFGEVPLGATRRIGLIVKNVGEAPLVLNTVDTTTPFAALIEDFEIGPQSEGRLDVAFTPVNAEQATGDLIISSNAEDAPMLTVALSGVGVLGVVEVLPPTIDLPNIIVGTAAEVELVVVNSGVEAVAGQIRAERFERPEHFSLSGLSRFDIPGDYSVSPAGDRVLDLVYTPFAIGADEGRLIFETCGPRCGIEVAVRASAAAASVLLDPPAVDFGRVGLGETKRETVRLTNAGNQAIEVTSIRAVGAGSLTAVQPPTIPVSVGPGGQHLLTVEFTPVTAGIAEGELIVGTTDPGVSEARVRLSGRGEGPLFEVVPPGLIFGTVFDLVPHRREFRMLNEGSSLVRVLDVQLVGDPELSLEVHAGLPHTLDGSAAITGVVVYTPTAVGMATGTVTVVTDDPVASMVEIPVRAAYSELACRLEVSPARLNFGLLPVGRPTNATATVRNDGPNACSVLSGAFGPPVDAAFSIASEPWPTMLAPGGTVDLSFRYEATAMVESKGSYVLTTDDPFFPDREIALVGSAENYVDLVVLPNVVDFGATFPGCNAGTRVVRLINLGTQGVSLSDVTVTSSSTEFALLSPTSFPVPVAAGGTQEIRINYTPVDAGADFAEFVLEIDRQPFPLIVPATGAGVPNPVVVDSFSQSLSREVDVLFIIDDSCSMNDEQQDLARNFGSFISTARSWMVDFQIGVTTTDTLRNGPQGRLVGPVLRDSPTLTQEFQSQALVGINGAGFEQGLDAMKRVFDRFDRGEQPIASLFRPSATRAVIIVSDEDDDSPRAVVNYFDILRDHSPSGFVTAVISGQANGCGRGALAGADRAPRYEEFVNLTSGVSESICTPDWAATLTSLGRATFGLRRQFPLSQPADPTSIEVRVDGALAPPGAWQYEAATNGVRFLEGSVPTVGALIEISYTPDC